MQYNSNSAVCKWDEMSIYERPSYKIEAKGSTGLSDAELVGLILGSGTRTAPIESIAQNVIAMLASGRKTLEDIMSIDGVDAKKAMAIMASLELGRRYNAKSGDMVTAPNDVYDNIRHYAIRNEQESFIVVSLNGAHEIIDTFVATVGLVNRTLIHPREVFSKPIAQKATAIVIAHNHPSGQVEPSEEDISATGRLIQSGALLGIKVLDHLIINSRGYYSFLEHGLI